MVKVRDKRETSNKTKALALAANRAQAKVRTRDVKGVQRMKIQVHAVLIVFALTN